MKINPYLGVMIAVSFGAFNGVLVKWLGLEATLITFFRVAIPALVLFLFLKFYKKIKLFKPGYKLMLTGSLLNAIRIFLYFLAFSYTTVSNGVIMLYTWPIFSSIFGSIFLKEKNRLLEWLLIIFAFLGVGVMMSNQNVSLENKDLIGMLIMLGSAAVWGLTLIIFKKRSDEYSPTESIFWQNLLGAFLFLPFIFIHGSSLTLEKSLVAITHYGFLVGILAFILIFTALKKLKVLHFSLTSYWEVIAGVLFGVIFLGDILTFNMAVGGLMIILAGIGLITHKNKQRYENS